MFAYRPIGIFRTPHQHPEGMPIQPSGADGCTGHVDVLDKYIEGLRDLDGFSHVHVIYHLHRMFKSALTVTPFLDTTPHGIFATRSPARPNPIGLSVLPLVRVDGNRVYFDRVDVLDGTPVLDLKPYVPQFDAYPDTRIGWFEGKAADAGHVRADDRFA